VSGCEDVAHTSVLFDDGVDPATRRLDANGAVTDLGVGEIRLPAIKVVAVEQGALL
jgi:hypothetical protein